MTSFVASENKECCCSLVKREAAPESRSIGSSSSSRMRAAKSPPLRLLFVAVTSSSPSSLSLRSLSLAYNTSSNASPVVGFFGAPYKDEVSTRGCMRDDDIALTSSLTSPAWAFFLFARSLRFLILTSSFAASSPLAHEYTSWKPKRRIMRSKMCRTFVLK